MVFVSYKSEDVELANGIKDLLQENGIDVWMAPYSIPIGGSYGSEIPQGITNSDIVVLVFTHRVQNSIWIPKELGVALTKDKRILPIVFTNFDVTEEFLFYLKNVQCVKVLDNNLKKALKELIDVVIEYEFNNIKSSWGPQDRECFDWSNRANTVTFNSISNNPFLGDERNFVRIRKAHSNECEADEVVLEPNTEYEVTIYYHNNAMEEMNASGNGIARNTLIRARFPSYINAGEIGVLVGFIKASNSIPNEVWDSCYLHAEDDYYIRFVSNSAYIYNSDEIGTSNGIRLSGDRLLGTGVLLGYYDNMWGMIPAGARFGGYIKFKIIAEKCQFAVISEVSKDGKSWEKIIDAKENDVLEFRIRLINFGGLELTGVTAHDNLSHSLCYINGSCFASSTRHPNESKSPDSINGLGLGLGAIISKEEVYIHYKARVVDPYQNENTICNNAYVSAYTKTIYDKVVINLIK